MKYNLPRAIIEPEMAKIIVREIRAQKMPVTRASAKQLKQIAEVCRIIEKEELPKHLVCKKIKGMGYGIFLHPKAKPILKGEVIAPYSGRVTFFPQNESDDSGYAFSPLLDIHLSKEEQKKFDPKRRYHPRRLYALDIDAIKEGNFTRFINHSEKPNVEADPMKIPPNRFGLEPSPLEVIYLAKKTIRPGEQLLISYEGEEKSYWNSMGIKPVPVTPRTYLLP